MQQLSTPQRELVDSLSAQLAHIPGIRAVVLGGSHARGRALPDSDIDLGLLYSEAAPFAIAAIRALAADHHEGAEPTVSGFYEWGRWVNGGAWLNIRGQRVDLLYRSIEHLQRVIHDCQAGRYEIDYAQQPPFGFFSATYLGEIGICVPVFDPTGCVATLKAQVNDYPPALRCSVVQDCLWFAEFTVAAFAAKFAARGDTYGTAGCLSRTVHQLIMALFALNGCHVLNDKTALLEVAGFAHCPDHFAMRAQQILGQLGNTPAQLTDAVLATRQLVAETCALAGNLYQPKYRLP